MGKKFQELENSLMVPQKENVITRFFHWVSNLFKKKNVKTEAPAEVPPVMIPREVKTQEKKKYDENSLEYFFRF